MSFLRRQRAEQMAVPKPVTLEDPANRIEDARRRRLASGGRASTWLSSAVAEAAKAGPPVSLTGAG